MGILTGLMLATQVEGKNFRIPDEYYPPQSIEDVYTVIRGPCDTIDSETGEEKPCDIPTDLMNAQCGGWNVGESVNGKIPLVEGLPGRRGDPFGNIPSGMARRDEESGLRADGLQYPDTAEGMGTVCDVGQNTIEKIVWDFEAQGYITVNCAHPYFEDPPCLWRRDGQTEPPPHTPPKCSAFCGWLNEYTYENSCNHLDCKPINIRLVCSGDPPFCVLACVDQNGNAAWQNRWLCSDEWIEIGPTIFSPAQGNCVGDLRGLENRCEDFPWCRRPSTNGGNGKPYRSFHRKYQAKYTRDAVPDVPADVREKEARAACYGFYAEFDPKRKITDSPDKRCIIDIDVSELPETQKGKGQYGQNSDLPDDPPIIRNPDFNEAEDVWYPNIGAGISFLNKILFEEELDRDLSQAILDADIAKMKAIYQIRPERPFAITNLLRAFDDTVSNERGDERTVVQWWQKFETDAHKLFTPPVVRLFLPAAWSFGVDPLDPLFVGPREEQDEAAGDPRMEAIEVQLAAREDLLGQIAAYLERSLLLNIQEEPVPVVVPLGSPTEFRAIAQAWETWAEQRKIQYGEDEPPSEVRALIEKLEDYARKIENVRQLRAELPRYIGRLLEHQKAITLRIGEWVEGNLNAYKAFLEQWRERRELQETWKELQQALVNFHDKTNTPWCKNDRFTTSIYSLLDPWLPGREALTGDGLPGLSVPDEEDFVFDLSTMQITAGSAKLPVLKPTQIRLNIPLPPPPENLPEHLDRLSLPDLPDVPSIHELVETVLPPVQEGGGPLSMVSPPVIDLEPSRQALAIALGMMQGMSSTYDEFWKSLRPNLELACEGWDRPPLCVHVETDLLERFTRIGARPAVLLREDFASRGQPRTPVVAGSDVYTCDQKDHACPSILPEKRFPRDGWQILFPETDERNEEAFLKGIRRAVRQSTLTEDAEHFQGDTPYNVTPDKLYPVFGVPRSVSLPPETPPTPPEAP